MNERRVEIEPLDLSARSIEVGQFAMLNLPSEKMTGPTVSVVMVVRNMERFLAESVESILDQSFRDFEFVILDFGSTDKSKEIITSYAARDSRIKFHKISTCSLPEARNAGCSLSIGRYIAIQDADDVSLRDRLLWEVDFMETNTEVGLLGGATEWVNAKGRPLRILDFPIADHEINAELIHRCVFCHSSLLIRREAFEFVGGYRKVFTQSHDYDLALRISERFRCANLRHVVVKYRIHLHQVSLTKRKQQTLCKLAAQKSAMARRAGSRDPLLSVEEITPAVLATLGVNETRQRSDIALDFRHWIKVMSSAGEYMVALKTASKAFANLVGNTFAEAAIAVRLTGI